MEHHHHQQHPHQQPHHQHPMEMEHDHSLAGAPYTFYPPPDGPDPSYGMAYPQQMSNYEVVHNAPPPRQMSASDLQHALQFRTLNLMPQHQYPPPIYPSSPPGLGLPLSASPPPLSPNAYDPLSPPVSGSDSSAEGIYISRNSSGAASPSSSRGSSLVHRHPIRYHPTPSPSGSSTSRRGRGRSLDSDEDEPGSMRSVVQEISHSRKEATRKQRIEAEQRRRDDLRDGYARLKDVLPVSNQKNSKVSLIERATNYIVQLDKTTRQMQTRLAALESEVQRLRAINEKISLSVGCTPEASGGQPLHPLDRPLSPPPECAQQTHSLSTVDGEPPLEDDGGNVSDGEF